MRKEVHSENRSGDSHEAPQRGQGAQLRDLWESFCGTCWGEELQAHGCWADEETSRCEQSYLGVMVLENNQILFLLCSFSLKVCVERYKVDDLLTLWWEVGQPCRTICCLPRILLLGECQVARRLFLETFAHFSVPSHPKIVRDGFAIV